MSPKKQDLQRAPDDALWLIPLGGSGEVGMNLNVYGTEGKWLMVDCGIIFPDEMTPGIEVIVPDPTFIADRKDDLVGIVVTHGHEDHLGAIEYLWSRFQCPVYATPFVAEILRSKMGERKDKKRINVRIIEIPVGGKFEIGPFKIDMIPVTHSVPESEMLFIQTKAGSVLHTGDWKFDSKPVVGALTDMAALKALGSKNVTAIVGDSTNAPVPGHSGSEQDAQDCIKSILGRYKHRVAISCFSSNIARIKSISVAARANGRHVALVGRSLWRNAEIAANLGYLPEFKQFLTEEEAMQSPRDKIVLICTGCQGEIRAALSRIAAIDHPEVELEQGDTVIFSSSVIPGNEKAIGRVQNLLLSQGIQVVTGDHEHVHVSGHCGKDEIAELYRMVKPKMSIPVHGELRHQTEHAQIARSLGITQVLMPINGQIVRLAPGAPEVVGTAHAGCLGLDGKVLRPIAGEALKHRRKLGYSGGVVVTLVINRRGELLADPQISLMGLEDDLSVEDVRGELIDVIGNTVDRLSKSTLSDDEAVKSAVLQSARRLLNETHGKKPMMEVNIMRV